MRIGATNHRWSASKKKAREKNENKYKLLAFPFVLQKVLAAVVEFLDLK